MSQGPLRPNLTQKVQREVSQIANHNLPRLILLGGLSVNLNHLKKSIWQPQVVKITGQGILSGTSILCNMQNS